MKVAKGSIPLDKEVILQTKEFELPYNKQGGSIIWDIKGNNEDASFNHFTLVDPIIDIDVSDLYASNF